MLGDFMVCKEERGMYGWISQLDVTSFLANAGSYSGFIEIRMWHCVASHKAHCERPLLRVPPYTTAKHWLKETAVQTRINVNKLKVFVPGRASTAFHQPTARGLTSHVAISSRILLEFCSIFNVVSYRNNQLYE